MLAQPTSAQLEKNLARGRPATQSSVSQWSNGRTVEADASGANNGKVDGQGGFHTEREISPWWQVDLQGIYLVREVRLFNRRDNADRLRCFSILGSLDGKDWLVLHTKNDNAIFGERDLDPYVAQVASDTVARFIRIRLDGQDVLHFCECEVFGGEADSATSSRLAAEFSAVISSNQKRQAQREQELRKGRQGHLANIGGNQIFVDTDKYSDTLVRTLSDGGYEGKERALVSELVTLGDRVIEIGTAVGAVSMAAARIVGPENVLTYEANPEIAADAKRNFEFNDLNSIQGKVGVLCNRSRFSIAPPAMDFFISRDFWASRLFPGNNRDDIVQTVKVPTACLEDEIVNHKANVIICDIEGGEIDLFIGADLSGIRLIIMEVHDWAVGAAATDGMMRWLIVNGFSVDPYRTGHGVVCLRR